MPTLYNYYERDFSHSVKVHLKLPFKNKYIETTMLYDFTGFLVYLSLYIPENNNTIDYFIELVEQINYGQTKMIFEGKITLPSPELFFGEIEFDKKRTSDFEFFAKFHGDPSWISSKQLHSSSRIYIYSETNLSDKDLFILKRIAKSKGHDIQFRSQKYLKSKTDKQAPFAFISHDSRDKVNVARKIAVNLDKKLCPVWYDEFSLKVGDNLRESIENGLKSCKKCILIISPNFISNNGWTKLEFDTIFTRELLQEKKIVLPIWYKVNKEQVYEYSPSLLNVKGLIWEDLGEDEVCRQLYNAIIKT